ncbi:MAG TPA: type II secretion system minor pseudopilin GspI [Solimonas sp.]|nr:type II secretion system minor pseudopilin GspI [Solimonas sp.]
MSGSRESGFTLIEMLVAVAVLAMAMGAILSGIARYTDSAALLRERTLATIVAHNRLTELELEKGWPDTGKSDGEYEMSGIKWKWLVEVKATPDPQLRRIELRVLAPDRQRDAMALTAFFADTGRQ